MERDYFVDYAGDGAPYDEVYRWYSGVDHLIEVAYRYDLPRASVCVLGAATGRVVADLAVAFGTRPWGCELSAWAHGQIPGAYRRRIACEDMRTYVPAQLVRGRRFDLTFCNSLVYLRPDEVGPLLAASSRLTRYFHFYSSTSESHAEHDRYRVTLEPRRWWRQRFLEAGFAPTRSPYLWRSVPLGARRPVAVPGR